MSKRKERADRKRPQDQGKPKWPKHGRTKARRRAARERARA